MTPTVLSQCRDVDHHVVHRLLDPARHQRVDAIRLSISRRSPKVLSNFLFTSTSLGDIDPNFKLQTSLRLDQTSNWFTVTLSVLWRTVHCTPWILCHLSCGLRLEACFRKPPISNYVRWLVLPGDVTRHVWIVMHVVSRFLRIFMRAKKQAYGQL